MNKTKAVICSLALTAALLVPSLAEAHDWDTPGWAGGYCGFGDGNFHDGQGDRYLGTTIVTPGATPGAPGQWHGVYHRVGHFVIGGPWLGESTIFCNWAYW